MSGQKYSILRTTQFLVKVIYAKFEKSISRSYAIKPNSYK